MFSDKMKQDVLTCGLKCRMKEDWSRCLISKVATFQTPKFAALLFQKSDCIDLEIFLKLGSVYENLQKITLTMWEIYFRFF
jgi:hypothetical protein